MAIGTSVSIFIDGEPLSKFSQLVINQKIQTHHKFSILQPISKEFIEKAIDKAKNYIGKTILIQIDGKIMKTLQPLVFKGIITEAQVVRTPGSSGGIIINGFSPTILMEGIPHTKSYNKKSVANIVKEVSQKYYLEEVRPKVDIRTDSAMEYTVQYAESDFAFLCRMAQKKGLWYYYNGEQAVFTSLTSGTRTLKLDYGKTLHTFNIEMRVKSLGFEYIGYDSSKAETKTINSKQVNYQPQGYAKNAFDASNRLFPHMSTLLYANPIEESSAQSHLKDRLTTQLQSRASDLITAKGESDETGLRIGDIVEINDPGFSVTGNPRDGLTPQGYGSYIITDIIHTCDETGAYQNTFEAVPSDVLAPPYGNVHSFPIAQSQPGIVKENNDPKGLHRVRVQFPWHKNASDMTPWIRIATPHAGKGKGFHIVPEIGEEVMVDFEGGNAEKPFVIGAMYNGKEKSSYHTPNNDKKVLQSKTGIKVVMDDSNGSLLISDKNNNTIKIDGDGLINLTSSKKVVIDSPNVIINGQESISLNSPDIKITGKDKVTTTSGSASLSLESSGGKSTLSGTECTVDGTNSATINANAKTTVSATGQTIVSGAIVKLN